MYFIISPKVFACCIFLASEIFTLEIQDYKYKRIEELNDKMSLDPEIFQYSALSTIQCVSHCAFIPNCQSVYYFQSSCKGYSVFHSASSLNLTLLSGARYYANVEEQNEETTTERNTNDTATERNTEETTTERNTDYTTTEGSTEDTTAKSEIDQTTSISTQFASRVLTTRNVMLDMCTALGPDGYIWDVSLEICYHLSTIKLIAVDAKAKCQSDHPNSRLLLIDSDEIYNVAVSIIDTFSTGPIYLQGTKSGSDFVDDDGQVITYFNWDSGQPGSGDYLRTDTDTRLQETSSGTSTYKFICRLY